MMITLRRAAAALLLGLAAASPSLAAEKKLRFAVGPFLPTASDTRKSYEPFFKFVAQSLNSDYELAVTVDWAGIAVALANDQVDLAWMGPWGYVLAAENGQARAIA